MGRESGKGSEEAGWSKEGEKDKDFEYWREKLSGLDS